MEIRYLALLRLCLKYYGTELSFTVRGQDTKIEMRIDGGNRIVKSKLDDYKLVRYLMYLANLDIGNMLIPQTGTIETELDGRLLKMRFAVIQSEVETKAVLRILNDERIPNYGGVLKNYVKEVQESARKGCGLYLITGPTGSGKTTLAYSILKSLKNVKVYSCEDPVECYIDSIVQVACNDAIGLTMDNAIKQVLRHDPDVIFVSEIRDEATAKMAVAAANTGHFVIATMHASACEKAITRMVEYGVKIEHLYENLRSIINLRLDKKEDGTIEQPVSCMSQTDVINYGIKFVEGSK